MKLYDNMIDVTMDVLSHSEGKRVAAASVSAWKCLDNSEFIMQRDAGLEVTASYRMSSIIYTARTFRRFLGAAASPES